MKRKYVAVSECKEGDILAEDILSNTGTLVVPSKTIITDNIIDRLTSFKITDVIIFISEVQADEQSSKPIQKLKKDYGHKTQQVKTLLEDFASGKNMDSKKVNEITDFMYNQVTSNYDIVQCISHIRSMGDMTYTHSMNVSTYAMLIGKWIELPEEDTKDLMVAGVLHDIGKVKIPVEILSKADSLTPEENEILKKHPIYGYEILKDVPNINENIKNAILMHHEREDGSGYPQGIRGDRINLFAKILSLADAYDLIMSQKNGQRFNTPFEAIDEFNKVGLGYFDAKILMTFLSRISNYYVGTKVKMSTGAIGEIISILPHSISKPIIKIGDKFIDLSKNNRIHITEIVDGTA
ncbi:MAG: HD-GYP domain-containing protein [Clostridia bacterium]